MSENAIGIIFGVIVAIQTGIVVSATILISTTFLFVSFYFTIRIQSYFYSSFVLSWLTVDY